MKRNSARAWLEASRPKTLLAAFAPVIIGTALAYADSAMHLPAAACALLSAVCIQVGTNFYNDFADFARGADTADRVGPRRATQAGLISPAGMKTAASIAFGLAVLTGGYLMWRGGWPIVVIGVLSIAAGYLYSATKFALAYVGAADLFVLIFFGPVAVGGTYYVQALSITPDVLIAGLAPGLLATAILLVNNIRDVNQDKEADKRTLVVRYGRQFGVLLYVGCIVLTALVPIALILGYSAPPTALAAALVLPLAIPLIGHLRAGGDGGAADGVLLNGTLAATARLLLLYSVVFAIGWNVGS